MNRLDRLRASVARLRGYSSARMEASGGRVLLNANESPWDDGHHCNRYPDPQPPALLSALAALYGVPADCLLVGRGSDEPIDLLTRAYCEARADAIVISQPTFAMYRVAAELQDAKVLDVPLDPARGFALDIDAVTASALDPRVKLVYVCTPNNPSGGVVARDDLLRLAARLDGHALVVVDEAYVEFSAQGSVADAVVEGANLAVLRTLSKAHGLAGARIGTLIAQPALIAVLRRLLAPYPLPTPSVEVALQALTPAGVERARQRIAAVVAERERVAARLAAEAGVRRVLPSAANFLAFQVDDADSCYRALLAAGVVVRQVGHYLGLGGFLRVSIGRAEENDAFLAALASALAITVSARSAA